MTTKDVIGPLSVSYDVNPDPVQNVARREFA
jgi:hypothetical protein